MRKLKIRYGSETPLEIEEKEGLLLIGKVIDPKMIKSSFSSDITPSSSSSASNVQIQGHYSNLSFIPTIYTENRFVKELFSRSSSDPNFEIIDFDDVQVLKEK
jgi:hypothetical protein